MNKVGKPGLIGGLLFVAGVGVNKVADLVLADVAPGLPKGWTYTFAAKISNQFSWFKEEIPTPKYWYVLLILGAIYGLYAAFAIYQDAQRFNRENEEAFNSLLQENLQLEQLLEQRTAAVKPQNVAFADLSPTEQFIFKIIVKFHNDGKNGVDPFLISQVAYPHASRVEIDHALQRLKDLSLAYWSDSGISKWALTNKGLALAVTIPK